MAQAWLSGLIVIQRTVRHSLPPLRPEIQVLVDAERDQARPIIVETESRRLHPIVRAERKIRKERKADDFGRLHFIGLSVTKLSLERAFNILNTFLLAAEERQFKTETQGGLAIVINKTPVKCRLYELVSRHDNAPTTKTKEYVYYPNRFTYTPTGRLTFEMEGYLPEGLRRRWSDRKDNPIEKHLNLIMAGVIAAAEAIRLRELEREEERRRYEEEEEWRRKEMARRDAVKGVIKAWINSRELYAFLDASEAHLSATEQSANEWMTWARIYARRVDPLLNGDLEKMIQREFGQGLDEDQ